MTEIVRCKWCSSDPLYIEYHDHEWGRAVHDDRKLFEMLVLEGMQAGLSWITILKKREAYRLALDNFDYQKIAQYDELKFQELMSNSAIIRNRLKINSIIINAQAFLKVQQEHGSFNNFIWQYVDFQPIENRYKKHEDIPAFTPLSEQISRDLKKLGFKFVGATIIYSFMQAVGMVNDHTTDCILSHPSGLL